MASFYGYNGDIDDSHWISSYNDDDLFPHQSSSTCSSYEFDVLPKSIQNCYDYNQSTEHFYSVYGYNEPTLIQYEQSPSFYVSESLYHNMTSTTTTYTTSYSTLEFNEPDFDEYDQTPYGGGYDIVQTYGKPLPPSDDICYPRFKSNRKERRVTFAFPESVDVENVVKIPQIPKGIETVNMPPLPIGDDYKDVGMKQQIPIGIEMENKPNADDHKAEDVVILEKKPIEVDDDSNRVDEDSGYDYGKGIVGNDEVPTNYPYGSGLEAMDTCDTIFGYWPCLEKIKKQNLANAKAGDDQERDPWTSAADYLFGSGYMYEEESRGNSLGHGYYFDGHHFDYSYK